MGCSYPGWRRDVAVGDRNVVDVKDEEGKPRKSCGRGPHKVPAEKPRLGGRLRLQLRGFVNRRQRKRDDRTAVRTDGEMGECLLLLV
jgi:hypothetical protein